jgi:hypothetical protein
MRSVPTWTVQKFELFAKFRQLAHKKRYLLFTADVRDYLLYGTGNRCFFGAPLSWIHCGTTISLVDLRDERFGDEPINVSFIGTLRLYQETAIASMLRPDNRVLCTPTAFSKTVTAAAMIARRGVNPLMTRRRSH